MLKGRVAQVLDNRTLVVNIGASDGVTSEMEFEVYEDTGVIRDPGSHEILTKGETIVKSRLEVQELRDNMAILETITNQYSISFGDFASLGSAMDPTGGFAASSQEEMKTSDDTPDDIMVVERGDPIRQVVEENEDEKD